MRDQKDYEQELMIRLEEKEIELAELLRKKPSYSEVAVLVGEINDLRKNLGMSLY